MTAVRSTVTPNGRPPHRAVDMASQILDVAERLVQQRGFSYADIAAELHVTKAALHYHFAGKTELREALIARYGARFFAALAALEDADRTAPARLEGYSSLYLDVLRNQRMCMCGMLAAEYQTLPERMRSAVIDFFNANEN
jgi:TetR/AcrR family transcriptional repressor of nem operon